MHWYTQEYANHAALLQVSDDGFDLLTCHVFHIHQHATHATHATHIMIVSTVLSQ
jgi:hypothetical protein